MGGAKAAHKPARWHTPNYLVFAVQSGYKQMRVVVQEFVMDRQMQEAKGAGAIDGFHEDVSSFPDDLTAPLKGKYVLQEKIGEGAQGSVFKAVAQDGSEVAIKCFDFRGASDWKKIELFKREVETLRTVSIKGIPRYIDYIESDSYFYLVESYIHAKSLQQRMREGFRPTMEQIHDILCASLRILGELHAHVPPIIHRDIKPGNILVGLKGDKVRVWIVDMGTVTGFGYKTNASTVAGTSGYVAPEQLLGHPVPASDIYSLGMTMVHLLSGKEPWKMDMEGLNLQYEKYLPSNMPNYLNWVLKEMLRPDPKQRLHNTEEALKFIYEHKKKSSQSIPIEPKRESQPKELSVSQNYKKDYNINSKDDSYKTNDSYSYKSDDSYKYVAPPDYYKTHELSTKVSFFDYKTGLAVLGGVVGFPVLGVGVYLLYVNTGLFWTVVIGLFVLALIVHIIAKVNDLFESNLGILLLSFYACAIEVALFVWHWQVGLVILIIGVIIVSLAQLS